MEKQKLILSNDQASILDAEGNVVYVAATNEEGREYFTKPENARHKKVCIEWRTMTVCVKRENGNCVEFGEKPFCIGWEEEI